MAFVAKRDSRTDRQTDGRTYRRYDCLWGSEFSVPQLAQQRMAENQQAFRHIVETAMNQLRLQKIR